MTNGIMTNAAAMMHKISSLSPHQQSQLNDDTTFLTGPGNALILIANEQALLKELDKFIANGSVSESHAIPVFIAMVSRQSQLLDHACFRVCDGREYSNGFMKVVLLSPTEYGAAKFFLAHAQQISLLRHNIFGARGPLQSILQEPQKGSLVANDRKLSQLLIEAREALKGSFDASFCSMLTRQT